MLVIITRSGDASVNLISQYFREPYIRINVDEDTSWSFSYQNGTWTIADTTNSNAIGSETSCWWWKVYFESDDGDSYRNAEVEYLAREIYAEIGRKGRIVGNPPEFS